MCKNDNRSSSSVESRLLAHFRKCADGDIDAAISEASDNIDQLAEQLNLPAESIAQYVQALKKGLTKRLTFERRELRPYALPVLAKNLNVGETYFAIRYADPKMQMPEIDTLIFVGMNLNDGDGDLAYFQAACFYAEGAQLQSTADNAHNNLAVYPSTELKAIFDFESALDELMKCYLRRQATNCDLIESSGDAGFRVTSQ